MAKDLVPIDTPLAVFSDVHGNLTPPTFYASLKRLRAVSDPWAPAHQPRVGDRFEGRVEKTVAFGTFVRAPSGLLALLREQGSVGDRVMVEVVAVDVAWRKLECRLLARREVDGGL